MKLDPKFINTPIAHRGLHDQAQGIIENSKSAFASAIQHGYGIECDIQLTKDARWAVFHDYRLQRLTQAKGNVRDFTLAGIKAIPLKNTDDKPQSINELFEQVSGRVPLLVEIKDPTENFEACSDVILQSLVESLSNYAGTLAIMSFNPTLMQQLRSLLPRHSLGIVTDDFDLPSWSFLSNEAKNIGNARDISGMNFISHNRANLNLVADLNIPKLCWTVRNIEQENLARKIADNITFEGYMPAHQ